MPANTAGRWGGLGLIGLRGVTLLLALFERCPAGGSHVSRLLLQLPCTQMPNMSQAKLGNSRWLASIPLIGLSRKDVAGHVSRAVVIFGIVIVLWRGCARRIYTGDKLADKFEAPAWRFRPVA